MTSDYVRKRVVKKKLETKLKALILIYVLCTEK